MPPRPAPLLGGRAGHGSGGDSRRAGHDGADRARRRAVGGVEGDEMAAVRFGVHIPTCIEGMMYPVPFAKPSDILPTAVLRERLGYDPERGHAHLTTHAHQQTEAPQPP